MSLKRQSSELFCVLDRRRERLLDQHMLSSTQSALHEGVVRADGRGDVDGVDRWIVEDVAQVRGASRLGITRRDSRQALCVDVADAAELESGDGVEIANDVW